MNTENLNFLADNIKYMGFGEDLRGILENNMAEGKVSFQLQYQGAFNQKPFEAVLNFRKSTTADLYFFNSYHAVLGRGDGQTVEQDFYLNKTKGVTAKEAFNLLEGRAVHKELVTKDGQAYKAWLQLDFEKPGPGNNFEVKHYHENYGFDLRTAVRKFAVAALNEPGQEKKLLQSLEKGNIQYIIIERDGASHPMFLEADPQFKKVNLFDANMQLVKKDGLAQYYTLIGDARGVVPENKSVDSRKDIKDNLKPQTAQQEKVAKKDHSLLPKKRTRIKKGLSIS